MPPTDTLATTPDRLLRLIIERPADDGPRLVLADWLEEFDVDRPRAEFIRVQCELAGMTEPPVGIKARPATLFGADREFHKHGRRSNWGKRRAQLRRRERELLERHGVEWATPLAALFGLTKPRVDFGYNGGGSSSRDRHSAARWEWSRGFVGHVTCDVDAFLGGVCFRCAGDGVVCGNCDGLGHTHLNRDLRRGDPLFAEYRCPVCDDANTDEAELPCPDCHGHGTTPGLAEAVASAAPVERVEVGDCEPYHRDDVTPHVFQWIEQTRREFEQELRDGGTPSSVMGAVHKDVFRLLTPHPKYRRRDEKANTRDPDNRRLTYPTAAAALDALGTALANVGRARVIVGTEPCGRCKGGESAAWHMLKRDADGTTHVSATCPACAGTGAIPRRGLPPLEGRR